jgi:hypothetical protein
MSEPLPNPHRHLIRAAKGRLAALVAIQRPWKAVLRAKPWRNGWQPGQPCSWNDAANAALAALTPPPSTPRSTDEVSMRITAVHQLVDEWKGREPSHRFKHGCPWGMTAILLQERSAIGAQAELLKAAAEVAPAPVA